MRNFTFKGLFLTAVFMLLGCLSIQAADGDLITRQITIKLDKAGSLPDRIGSRKKYKITNLKIVGEINGTDWRMIRAMAGRDYFGGSTEGNLSVLDLSEAKIVEGGDEYYFHENGYYSKVFSTSNDEIGDYAFKDCSVLTSLTLPSSLATIGNYAFEGCSGLMSLNLPSSISRILQCAFKDCSGLTSITLHYSLYRILYSDAFSGCSELKEVNFCINNDLETYLRTGHPYINVDCGINYYLNDKKVTSIVIPSSVTSLGDNVFQKCSGLTSLTLPSSITKIGFSAFRGCSGLTSLNLPSSITEIDNYAFMDCSGLTSITLHSGLDRIDYKAFSGCSELKEVNFCINNDYLETYLRKGHPLINVGCDINYYLNDKKVTSIVIPSIVTSLGDYVFQECTTLQSLFVSWPTPIPVGNAFYGFDTSKCTLYVPQGTEQDYFLADVWGDFKNIVEFDPTGIDKTTTSTDVEEVSRYSVNGQRLAVPVKGLNIVKYSDGSVKKVVVL